MDFNIVVPNRPTTNKQHRPLLTILRQFLPIFMLSLLLPFFVVLAMRPSELRFMTKADQNLELRLWFEPSTVIVNSGDTAELRMVALFEADTKLIPTLTATAKSSPAVSILNGTLSYKKPFRGQVVMGTVKVAANDPGTYGVTIPIEEVQIQAFSDEVKILSTPAKIIVK